MSKINIVLFEVHRQEALATISELPYPLSINRAIQDYGELLREWVKVQAVLTAAERVRQTPFYKRVALIDAVINLNNTVRDLEEIEAIDGRKTD